MDNPFLVGEHVYLRAIERADAARFARWFNDPEVRRNVLSHQPVSVAAEEAWIERAQQNKDLVLAIVLRAGDEPVGVTGLHDVDVRHRSANFGIVVGDPSARGKGRGTEATRLLLEHAFDTLNLHRVQLECYADNQPAIRCYEKVGFRREGALRERLFREGRFHDALVMGVLASELRR